MESFMTKIFIDLLGKIGMKNNRISGKLFKTPISERWGKQICLNE